MLLCALFQSFQKKNSLSSSLVHFLVYVDTLLPMFCQTFQSSSQEGAGFLETEISIEDEKESMFRLQYSGLVIMSLFY